MTELVLTHGKVSSLVSYLGYFFLRFPGALTPEESWQLEFLDTWDQQWGQKGQAWVRHNEKTFLASPPALFSLPETRRESFGLWAPLVWGRSRLSIRRLSFETPSDKPLDGLLIRARGITYLTLESHKSPFATTIVDALLADGLEEFIPRGIETVAKLLRPAFVPALIWDATDTNSTAKTFLVDRAKDGFRVARQYEKGIQADVDTECLHQYRVQLRRVRSILAQGRNWKNVDTWDRLKELFKVLMNKTGELRDLDVLILELPLLVARLPLDTAPELASWQNSILTRRKKANRALSSWLASTEHAQLVSEISWEILAEQGEDWSVTELARISFIKTSRGLKRALAEVRNFNETDESLHAVRIQTKKMRYVLEIFAPLAPEKSVRRLLSVLRRIQLTLGKFQDSSLRLTRLRTEASSIRAPNSGIDPFAYGLLIGVLWAEHAAEKTQAIEALKRLQSQRFRQELARVIKAFTPEVPHGQ